MNAFPTLPEVSTSAVTLVGFCNGKKLQGNHEGYPSNLYTKNLTERIATNPNGVQWALHIICESWICFHKIGMSWCIFYIIRYIITPPPLKCYFWPVYSNFSLKKSTKMGLGATNEHKVEQVKTIFLGPEALKNVMKNIWGREEVLKQCEENISRKYFFPSIFL